MDICHFFNSQNVSTIVPAVCLDRRSLALNLTPSRSSALR